MEEKFIEVYDDIISSQLVDKIHDLTLGTNTEFPWHYKGNLTYSSNDPLYTLKPGMHHVLYHKGAKQSHYLAPFFQILYEFSFKRNLFVEDIFRINSYLDLPNPNPGADLPPHVDTVHPHFVLLYYINDSEGDTILFEEDEKTIIKKITPKKGRLIFFDGHIFHCGSTPGTSTRAIINYNFLGGELDKK